MPPTRNMSHSLLASSGERTEVKHVIHHLRIKMRLSTRICLNLITLTHQPCAPPPPLCGQRLHRTP